MTREQLLALLREVRQFIWHLDECASEANWDVACDCGALEAERKVADALATERTEPTQ